MLSVFEKNRTSKVISSLLELFYQKPILKILRNSQENTCVGDCFWIKLESVVMQLHYRRFWPYMEKAHSKKSIFWHILHNLFNIFNLNWNRYISNRICFRCMYLYTKILGNFKDLLRFSGKSDCCNTWKSFVT